MQLLDPKNDLVFNKAFGQSSALLEDLINAAVRSASQPVERQPPRGTLTDQLRLNVIEQGKADRLMADGRAQPGMSTSSQRG